MRSRYGPNALAIPNNHPENIRRIIGEYLENHRRTSRRIPGERLTNIREYPDNMSQYTREHPENTRKKCRRTPESMSENSLIFSDTFSSVLEYILWCSPTCSLGVLKHVLWSFPAFSLVFFGSGGSPRCGQCMWTALYVIVEKQLVLIVHVVG